MIFKKTAAFALAATLFLSDSVSEFLKMRPSLRFGRNFSFSFSFRLGAERLKMRLSLRFGRNFSFSFRLGVQTLKKRSLCLLWS